MSLLSQLRRYSKWAMLFVTIKVATCNLFYDDAILDGEWGALRVSSFDPRFFADSEGYDSNRGLSWNPMFEDQAERIEAQIAPRFYHQRRNSYRRPSRRRQTIDPEDILNFVEVFSSLNWSQSDSQNFQTASQNWDFEAMLNIVFSKLLDVKSEDIKTKGLNLLQKYSPPKSLMEAAKAFTIEQKAQIRLLVSSHRRDDLKNVIQGLIASLPDEDQRQARMSVSALKFFSGGSL
uniref:Uncharacterized protein n=1 Tax=Ditylenchus dipsaci TaxID=166011 RepID=A0A915E3E4_9BILA